MTFGHGPAAQTGQATNELTQLRLVSRMRELEREKTGNEAEIPALAIIGAGRVGSALHRAADTAGIEARLAGRFDAAEACVGAELALLCVPDAAIEEHSQELAELYRVLAERTRALAGADAEVTA